MARGAHLWWLLTCIVLVSLGAPARADTVAGSPLELCVARVRPGDSDVAMFGTPARFDCRTAQTSFGPGDYWVVARAPAPASNQVEARELRFLSLWQRRTTVVARYADGKAWRVGLDGAALARHLRPGAIVELHLPPRRSRLTEVLWRVDGSANLRGIVAGAALADVREGFAADLAMTALLAGFAALCLTLLIYNVALLAAMRHRFQIAYCAMVGALLAYAGSSSGAFAWLCPGVDSNTWLRANYASLALSASAALIFARYFFERRVLGERLTRSVSVVAAGPLCGAALYVLVAPVGIGWIDRLYCASFLPVLAMLAATLWRAWRTRSELRWLFAAAWGAPMLMGAARTAAGLRLIAPTVWIEQSTVVAMSLEALLSSLAIAYRIRLLGHERDRAREGEERALLLADTDPLTGLLNRRAFLRHAIGRADDQVLALADIDHFKTVNEALGHDGGDEVLRLVARALRTAAPPGALIARLGGEEFAVLGSAAAPPDPETLLARVRAERMPFDIAVTISLGTCAGPLGDEGDWKALYRRADAALFAAKAGGRDRARAAQLGAQAA